MAVTGTGGSYCLVGSYVQIPGITYPTIDAEKQHAVLNSEHTYVSDLFILVLHMFGGFKKKTNAG